MDALQYLGPIEWTAIEVAVLVIVLAILLWWSGVVRYIPNDRLGILEKLWSFRGSISNGFIALNREAGYQPEVVRGGLHFFMPFQYSMHRANLVTIPQGQIGYVFARDGKPLPPTQTLACNTDADDFQDVRGFLEKGGQKGQQRKILREGTYAINLAQFIVLTAQSIYAVSYCSTSSTSRPDGRHMRAAVDRRKHGARLFARQRAALRPCARCLPPRIVSRKTVDAGPRLGEPAW